MAQTKRMLHLVSALDPEAQDALIELNKRLAGFYNAQEAKSYFDRAESDNESWDGKPYHEAIRSAMKPGMEVLELGCGSGHAVSNIQDREVKYTGVDWSQGQVERNRQRYGEAARFIDASLYEVPLPDGTFDLVFSTYVLEHLVWPHRFLDEALRLTKPGGQLIILCPEFRHEHRIPSLRYTSRVAPLKDKIRSGHVIDTLLHAWRRYGSFPATIRKHYPRRRFPFLINLEPSCLEGPYYPDNDAVYFVDQDEVRAYLHSRGARVTSEEILPGRVKDADTCFISTSSS